MLSQETVAPLAVDRDTPLPSESVCIPLQGPLSSSPAHSPPSPGTPASPPPGSPPGSPEGGPLGAAAAAAAACQLGLPHREPEVGGLDAGRSSLAPRALEHTSAAEQGVVFNIFREQEIASTPFRHRMSIDSTNHFSLGHSCNQYCIHT